jgi:hypothetical protein
MTKQTALCDQCDKITDVEFKKDKHPNGIEETYFKCEHCYYRYTSFVTDSWVRKKQRALKTLPRHTDNTQVLDDRQLEINQRMSQLKYNLINYGRADL